MEGTNNPVPINFVPPCFRDNQPSSVQDCLLGLETSKVVNGTSVSYGAPYGVIPYYASQLYWVVGLVAFFFLLYGGYQMLTGFGDAAKYERAKSTITYAIIGVLIAIFAGLAVRVFVEFLSGKGL